MKNLSAICIILTLFWVGCEDSTEPVITIELDTTSPSVISPLDNEIIRDANMISIRWQSAVGALSYDLEVSTDLNFTVIAYSVSLADTSATTTALTQSNHYWRVKGKNDIGEETEWSDIRNFSIEGPIAPEQNIPSKGTIISDTLTPVFGWRSSQHAVNYHFVISSSTAFSDTIISDILSDTSTVTSVLSEGWQYWQVRAQNAVGFWSDWSDIRSVRIGAPQALVADFVPVPAGTYTFGQNDETRSIDYDYDIMKYDVTNEQYLIYLEEAKAALDVFISGNLVMGTYAGDDNNPAGDYLFYTLGDTPNANYGLFNWDGSSFLLNDNQYENHPVVEVSWFGANAFAKFYGLHLPDEFEWEKAARGNTGADYPWGEDFGADITDNANYAASGFNGTNSVGYYNGLNNTTDSPSPFGAYDMAGNVWNMTTYSGAQLTD